MAQLQAEHKEYVMLERELEYWKANREALTKQYPQMWLLIKGEELVGCYASYKEVLDACTAVDTPLMQYVTASVEEPTYNLPSVYLTSIDA